MSGDETRAVATPDFHRRRWTARLRRWRPLLIAGLALAVVLTGIWLVCYSSVVTVRGVEVVGNNAVSAQRIAQVARAPIGTPLVRADLAPIQARVEAIPEIKSVSVSRSWLHTIRIEVTERVPVAVVNRDPGTPGAALQAVDLGGVLFGSYPSDPPGLPLIRTDPDVSSEVLAEAAKVVTSLRADIAAKVVYVDVGSIDDISLRLSHGPKVLWGSADDSAAKAEVLAVLLKNVKQGVSQIDVRTPGKPSTK